MSDRLAVLPQYVLPKQALTSLAGTVASARGGAATTRADPLVRAPLRRRHGRGRRARHRALPELQRVLHPRAQARRAAARRSRPDLPGGRRDQPVRRHRARPDLPGQGPPLLDHGAGRRRRGARRAVRRRPLRDALPEPEGLSPHPHAVRRPAAAHDPRAGRAVLGQPDHGARRAGPVRAQRARGLRVRVGARPVRAGAGGRHHRRQHGHRLARRRQPAAQSSRCASGTTASRTCA